jgi:hypothetical protein
MKRRTLSAEAMASLAEGRGTPSELSEWRMALVEDRDLREELAGMSKALQAGFGTLPGYVVDGMMERFFPIPGKESIFVELKNRNLRVIESAGWSSPVPAYRDAPDTPGNIVNLSRQFEGLKIDVRVVRIKDDALELTVIVKDLLREGAPTMKVSLLKNGRIVGSRFLRANQAQFREIRPGDYAISLSHAEEDILKIDFKVAN